VVNLKNFFTDQQIERAKSFQEAYAKWFSEAGI